MKSFNKYSSQRPAAFKVLEAFCPEELYEEIEGDLIQRFERDEKKSGTLKAKLRLWWNVIMFFRPGILMRRKKRQSLITLDMLQNYFIVMLRGMRRNLGYTWINIIGLTLGITCAIIIFAHVQDELTYDHLHLNRHHIYRLNTTYAMPNGETEEFATAGPPVGEILSKEFPEIEQYVRIRTFSGFSVEHPSSQMLFHENLYTADSTLFKIFSFSFLSGNPEKALHDIKII